MKHCIVVALVVLATCDVLCAQEVLDYSYFVSRLTDLDALPQLEAGTSCRQFSSFDRASLDPAHWDANGDAGQYLTYDPALYGPPLQPGEALMAQMDGPGCIFRIWSANPQGKIRFYLDGDTEPTYEFDFDGLFRGQYEDFQAPFVYKGGARQSASDCYLPIPYASSCRVTADQRWGQYYHIGYMTYPRGTRVETFRWPLDDRAKQACAAAAAKWNACGDDPRPMEPGDRVVVHDLTLPPQEPVTVAQLEGPAVLQTLRARLEGPERYLWRKVLLKISFDDEPEPCVLCPLGELFGTGWQANEYRSYPLGVIGGEGYCYLPMPFRTRARIEVLNRGIAPAHLSFTYRLRGLDALPADTGLFHAKWRREAPCTIFDYPILEATGRGRFVGVALFITNPMGGWWGEGDEKVWVDGEDFPSIYGTGSEDYFGHAWGMQNGFQPMFGASFLQGDRTCCFRWHISDHIPFSKSYRMTIENYPPFAKDYTTVAYWYQAPGGSDFFSASDVDDWRPWGRSLPNTVEAEDIWQPGPGDGFRIVTDDALPREYSHGCAVDFGSLRGGQVTPTGRLQIPRADVYFLTAYVGSSVLEDLAPPLILVVDGEELEPLQDQRMGGGWVQFRGIHLEPGTHEVALRVVEAGELVVDCLKLDPAPRVDEAVEAESLEPAEVQGGAAVVETGGRLWSAGRQLALEGASEGSALTVQIPGHDTAHVNLTLQVSTGPEYGDLAVSWCGETVGETVSCYSDHPGLKQVPLGQVTLTGANRALTLHVVGKQEAAMSYKLGLDCIILRRPLYPGAVEAETARVLDVRGGGLGPQTNEWMPGLSGKTHLFFTNREPDGYVELEFSVPEDGTYAGTAWFSHSHDYAIVQVLVDGQPVGAPVDGYAAGWVYGGPVDLGSLDLAAGTHSIRFQAVGKNEASAGYFMGIDCFRFQKQLRPGATEAETARVLKAVGGPVVTQSNPDMPDLSGQAQLWFQNSDPKGYVDIECSVPADGEYELTIWFTKSWDYAIVQISLDGSTVGEAQDLYNPSWVHGGETRLGTVLLAAGKHVLRFQSVGKNEASGGYLVGVDGFRLRRR